MKAKVIVPFFLVIVLGVVIVYRGYYDKLHAEPQKVSDINDVYINMIDSLDNKKDSYVVSPILADYQVAMYQRQRGNGRVKTNCEDSGKPLTWNDTEERIAGIISGLNYHIIDQSENLAARIEKYSEGLLTSTKRLSDITAYLELPLEFPDGTVEDDDYVYVKSGVLYKDGNYCIDLCNGRYQFICYRNELYKNGLWENYDGVVRIPRDFISTELLLNKSWKSMFINMKELGIKSGVSQIILMQVQSGVYTDDKAYDATIEKPYKFMIKDGDNNILAGGIVRG